MGTGGYVSGPLVRQAAKMGIPTLTHEQNAFPGVTTKLLSKYVDCVMLAVPEAKKYLSPNARCVVTGNPVREAFLPPTGRRYGKKMGLDGKICVLSFGGSLGARRVNEAMAELIAHNKITRIFFISMPQAHMVRNFFQNFCGKKEFQTVKQIKIWISGNIFTICLNVLRQQTW